MNNSDTSHYENVPFEVPGNWYWVKVADISSVIVYGVSESAKSEGKYKLLRITDIQDNAVNWNTVPYTDYPESKSENYILQAGDILFARTGATVGKSYLVDDAVPENAIYASYLIRVRVSKMIIPQYVKYFFESGFYWEQIVNNSVGVGQPNVNGSSLGNLWVPIPPIQEQRRIVDKLASWCLMIDKISVNQELITQQIEELRNHILNLAISGKLVPQETCDEPAKELLKRINPIFSPTDNRHYENIELSIPETWCWATVGDLFNHNTGKALNSSNHSGIMMDYITTSNLYWDRFDLSTVKQMPFTEKDLEKCTVTKGDLLICEGGDVGRSAIWNYNYDIRIQNHIHRLRGKANICVRYFFYVFMLYKQRNYIGGKGVAIQGLSSRDLNRLVIPLPPLNEQYRIAKSVDNLFSTIDNILLEL